MISRHSKITLVASSSLWAIITAAVCALMYFDIQVSSHFSFEILLEFAKAIDLWYIICVICAFIIDRISKLKK